MIAESSLVTPVAWREGAWSKIGGGELFPELESDAPCLNLSLSPDDRFEKGRLADADMEVFEALALPLFPPNPDPDVAGGGVFRASLMPRWCGEPRKEDDDSSTDRKEGAKPPDDEAATYANCSCSAFVARRMYTVFPRSVTEAET